MGSISITLPVNLLSFAARRQADYSRINWTISNEVNTTGYELERSDDGISFHRIAALQAYNRNLTEFYFYDDKTILHGTAYYRLHIIGNNRETKYSPVVSVAADASGNTMYVVKNPVTSSIDIYAAAATKGEYNYSLINSAGQAMQSGKINFLNEGVQSIQLKAQIATGAYVLIIKNAHHNFQKTIFKQ